MCSGLHVQGSSGCSDWISRQNTVAEEIDEGSSRGLLQSRRFEEVEHGWIHGPGSLVVLQLHIKDEIVFSLPLQSSL